MLGTVRDEGPFSYYIDLMLKTDISWLKGRVFTHAGQPAL